MITKILMAIYAATSISCCREYFRVMRILEKKYEHERQNIFVILGNNIVSIVKCFIPIYHFIILISLFGIQEE